MNSEILADIPSNWALTPVKNKEPYRSKWQVESPVSREFIVEEIKNNRASGFGLRTGVVSGCVLAVDFDGESAIELMMNLPHYQELPKTVSWASGKQGRCQLLFKIPEKYRKDFENFTNTKLKELNGFKCAEGEQLEFFYNGRQSVLPPSKHPETGQYQWVNSPQDTDLADLPQFIIDFLIPLITPQRTMNNNPYERYLTDLMLPINESVPLIECIAPISRELLDGVGEGRRDNTGASLIRDLLGTANYLSNIGQSYNGDPYDLLYDFCRKCSPPLKPKDCDRIYKSAQKSNPKPCLDEEKIKGCIGAWYWKNSDVKKSYIDNPARVIGQKAVKEKREPKINKFDAIKEAKQILMADHDELTTTILLDDVRLNAGISEYSWENKYIKALKREVKQTRLRLEISLYTQEIDVFKKVQIKQKICSNYSLNSVDFMLLVNEVEKSHNEPEKKCFTFKELMALETVAYNWLIPSFLPKGEMVLLTALPKFGKTLLATDLTYAVLSGGEAFGEKTTQGKVLYVSSDETTSSLIRRFQSRGFDLLPEETTENLEIFTYLDLGNLGELERKLEDFKPDLVVIDSLTSITLNLGVSENDAEFAKYVYRLKDLLKKYNSASILIHHENKSGQEGILRVSGSARITAAVWGIAQLSGGDKVSDNPDNELVKGQNIRYLDLQPREGEKVKYQLEINPKTLWSEQGIFDFQGDFDDPQDTKKTQGEQVLYLLNRTGKRLEYSEINEVLGMGKSLYQVLERLCDRNLVNRARSKANPRRWVYWTIEKESQEVKINNDNTSDEKTSTPPPLTISSKVVELNSESIDYKRLEVIQQVSQQISQQTDVLMDNKNDSNEDVVSDSGLFNNFPQNRGGGGSEVIVDPENEKNVNCENTLIVENTLINYSDFENQYNSTVVTDNEQEDLLAMYLDADEVEIIEVIFDDVVQKGINGLVEIAHYLNAKKESCYRLLEVMKKFTI